MNNISSLTKAIKSKFKSDTSLIGVNVTRSQVINRFPSLMPWIGIYPGSVETEPNALGSRARGKRWKEVVLPRIIVQVNNLYGDGEAAADDLEDLIETVMLVVDSDLTFGLSGVRVVGANREYTYVQSDEDEEGELFFPQCEITLTVDMRYLG